MSTTPPELVDAFARGGGIVFVGAGLSMAAGYPDWNTLVQPLRDEIADCPPNASYPDVAQWYELQAGRGFLMQRLKRALSNPNAQPTNVHRALLRLPLHHIYTSNFDDLIEQTARELGLPLEVVIDGTDLSIREADRMHLVKIHGDLAQMKSVTITSDDYELFTSRKPQLSNLLRVDLQTHVALFIGYSFSDDNLKLILAQARQDGGTNPRNRFAVMLNASPAMEAMLRHKGIVPVTLSTQPGQDKTTVVAEWLAEFVESVNRVKKRPDDRLRTPEIQRTHNLPLPPAGFLGREPELADVIKGLASRYPLVSIEGFAGVGKTSLAIYVGYACALIGGPKPPGTTLFDYVVWVSAKDKPDQAEWLDDVLNAIANTTGYLAISQLSSAELERKRNQVDLLLHTFRVLLIIDNLETINDDDLIAWIEATPAPSKVLVTTRNSQLNQKAYAVPLGGLRRGEAMELLKAQIRQLDITPTERRLADLAEVTGRNPQAMRLALGLIRGGLTMNDVINGLGGATSTQSVEPLFKVIFDSSWKIMGQPARAVLLTTPLFVGVGSIRRDALVATAGLSEQAFDERMAIAECVKLGLLEADSVLLQGSSEQRFIVHPMTRSFARSQWRLQPGFETQARTRLVTYFLELVRQNVLRTNPPTPYWNALVSDGMLKVDPEWPSILELMRWCDETGHTEELFDFTLMLVHYMDSRFHNNDRLYFVKRSVEIAQASGRRYDEALLRIDALGWTYAEERRFDEAKAEIRAGIAIAEALRDGTDLLTLAWAWLARIEAEQEQWEMAQEAIKRADGRDTPPWIAFRVLIAKGDIELKIGKGGKALQSYQTAAQASASYGDEGRGYQTKPRIGLAYLATATGDDYSQAEQVFQELTRFGDMVIAELYGEYGLAMIAHQKGEAKGADALVQDVRERLLRRTSSNLLLNMTQKLQMELESRRSPPH